MWVYGYGYLARPGLRIRRLGETCLRILSTDTTSIHASPGVAWSAAHACAQRVDDFWQLFRARAARGAHTQARLGGAACSSPRSIKRTSWRERLGKVRACAGQGSGALIGRPKYRGTLRLLHVSSGRSCWRPQRWRPQRYAGAWRQASRPRSTVADHCTGAVYF